MVEWVDWKLGEVMGAWLVNERKCPHACSSAMESSEQANLIAPLKSPSPNFREIALHKYLAGSWGAFL